MSIKSSHHSPFLSGRTFTTLLSLVGSWLGSRHSKFVPRSLLLHFHQSWSCPSCQSLRMRTAMINAYQPSLTCLTIILRLSWATTHHPLSFAFFDHWSFQSLTFNHVKPPWISMLLLLQARQPWPALALFTFNILQPERGPHGDLLSQSLSASNPTPSPVGLLWVAHPPWLQPGSCCWSFWPVTNSSEPRWATMWCPRSCD